MTGGVFRMGALRMRVRGRGAGRAHRPCAQMRSTRLPGTFPNARRHAVHGARSHYQQKLKGRIPFAGFSPPLAGANDMLPVRYVLDAIVSSEWKYRDSRLNFS